MANSGSPRPPLRNSFKEYQTIANGLSSLMRGLEEKEEAAGNFLLVCNIYKNESDNHFYLL